MGLSKINYEAIPGDSHLVDLDGHMSARHAKGNSHIVLIPTPSNDPEDPLNWSQKRKYLSLFCMVVYTFGVGVPSAAIYSILPQIASSTGITLGQLNAGTGYMFLFFGIGCMVFQPLALQYGKRPVYLFSVLSTALICIWAPFCKTNAEWIGSKILQGFVGSPIESLCEISASDVSFQHQLSRHMAIYAVSLLASNFMAPMLAGFITDGIGWEWVMYLCTIFGGVCFIFLFFFMEETNYERKLKPKKLVETLDGIGNDDEELAAIKSDEEKKLEVILSRKSIEERLHETNENFEVDDDGNNSFDGISSTSEENYKIKTFKDKLSLFSGGRSKFLLPHFLLGPIKMAQFPPVLWSGFLYGSSLVWFNLLNATEATILGGEPYHFSSAMCGLAYISPTVFSVIFQILCGHVSDYMKVFIAKKRGGLSIPEDRLWALIVYMVFGFLSSIGWGVGAYYGKHWFLLVFSMGMLGGLGIFGVIAACTYASDCYHEMETEAMVVVIVIRNLMSFACSYGLTDWVVNLGYKHAFLSSACILFFCNGTFLVMRYTGPYWRASTKVRYWKLVEHNRKVIAGH